MGRLSQALVAARPRSTSEGLSSAIAYDSTGLLYAPHTELHQLQQLIHLYHAPPTYSSLVSGLLVSCTGAQQSMHPVICVAQSSVSLNFKHMQVRRTARWHCRCARPATCAAQAGELPPHMQPLCNTLSHLRLTSCQVSSPGRTMMNVQLASCIPSGSRSSPQLQDTYWWILQLGAGFWPWFATRQTRGCLKACQPGLVNPSRACLPNLGHSDDSVLVCCSELPLSPAPLMEPLCRVLAASACAARWSRCWTLGSCPRIWP